MLWRNTWNKMTDIDEERKLKNGKIRMDKERRERRTWKVHVCVLSVCMCVRHIPFLAGLQSRRDLQARVSPTTFYCRQACERWLLFGRGLNPKSNKLGFFIWPWFQTAMGVFRFSRPQSERGRGDGGGGGGWKRRKERVSLSSGRKRRRTEVRSGRRG